MEYLLPEVSLHAPPAPPLLPVTLDGIFSFPQSQEPWQSALTPYPMPGNDLWDLDCYHVPDDGPWGLDYYPDDDHWGSEQSFVTTGEGVSNNCDVVCTVCGSFGASAQRGHPSNRQLELVGYEVAMTNGDLQGRVFAVVAQVGKARTRAQSAHNACRRRWWEATLSLALATTGIELWIVCTVSVMKSPLIR